MPGKEFEVDGTPRGGRLSTARRRLPHWSRQRWGPSPPRVFGPAPGGTARSLGLPSRPFTPGGRVVASSRVKSQRSERVTRSNVSGPSAQAAQARGRHLLCYMMRLTARMTSSPSRVRRTPHPYQLGGHAMTSKYVRNRPPGPCVRRRGRPAPLSSDLGHTTEPRPRLDPDSSTGDGLRNART